LTLSPNIATYPSPEFVAGSEGGQRPSERSSAVTHALYFDISLSMYIPIYV